MAKKVVSVVLPTYNERENLEKFVSELLAVSKKIPDWQIKVIIADSHSPDGTIEVAKKLAAKNQDIHYLEVGRGLGVGLILGHQYALEKIKPDLLAQMDADGQVDPEVLVHMVHGYEEGYTLILGSRFVPGGKNELSLSRKIFSLGSSLVCRILIGPLDIKEVTNSARAFTPELFNKINLKRLPWKDQTFIVQPSFLHEAILAGGKYKEVPLVFKNRAEGYSKNKVVNYTYDMVIYALDIFIHRLGIRFPLFYLARRAKTVIKFGLVGIIGTTVDFVFYNLLIGYFMVRPATSKGISAEIAILNNFILNNFWTFKYRKTGKSIYHKLGLFNLVSFGGLLIGALIVKFLHTIYGDGYVNWLGIEIAYYNLYFFATVPFVMTWNFVVNHLVTWKHQE